MSRILVTGATGFIGRHAVRILKNQGHEVLSASRFPKEPEGIALDLKDTALVRAFLRDRRPEYLLHLAWNVDEGYADGLENPDWVIAGLELLKAFGANGGKRAVYAGSCMEYDWKYGFLSEGRTPLDPASLYGISKAALFKVAAAWAARARLSFAWGRIFFLYGEGEKKGRLVPSIIEALLRGEKALLKQPFIRRDYMHVRDVAAAFVRLLESDFDGAVNIASGEAVTPEEIGRLICRVMSIDEKQLELSPAARTGGEYPLVMGDTARLRDELEFSPALTLSEGLKAAVDWWEERPAG